MKVTIDFQKLATGLAEIEPIVRQEVECAENLMDLIEQLYLVVEVVDHNQPIPMDKLDTELLKELFDIYNYQHTLKYHQIEKHFESFFHGETRKVPQIFQSAKPKLGGKSNELFF